MTRAPARPGTAYARALHAHARATLRDWQAPSAAQERLRADYLALLDARPDALHRDCAPAHLTASAAVLDPDGRHTCLVLHAKVRLWLNPGGHAEPVDTTLGGAALREATEETGIPGLVLLPGPLRLDRHRAPCAPGVVDEHFDVQFAAVAPTGAVPVASVESYDVGWFPVDRLPAPNDAAVRRLVEVAAAVLRPG